MKVSDAIALLTLMPADAILVGTDGPITKKASKGSVRLGVNIVDPVLSGFSEDELKREEWEFFLLGKSNIVILAMTQNSDGEDV